MKKSAKLALLLPALRVGPLLLIGLRLLHYIAGPIATLAVVLIVR